jgi:hypothetical protein
MINIFATEMNGVNGYLLLPPPLDYFFLFVLVEIVVLLVVLFMAVDKQVVMNKEKGRTKINFIAQALLAFIAKVAP